MEDVVSRRTGAGTDADVDAQIDNIVVEHVPQDERELFDAAFTLGTGQPAPLAPISEAFVALDRSTRRILGVSYVHIRHLMGPWTVDADAPPSVLSHLGDAVGEHLRSLSSLSAALGDTPGDAPDDAPPDAPALDLSYDIYVPPGEEPPAGFEQLAVEVWKRGV